MNLNLELLKGKSKTIDQLGHIDSQKSKTLVNSISDTVGLWGSTNDSVHLFYLCHIAGHIKAGDQVLDLACGNGDFLLKVVAKYPKVQFTGSDASVELLEEAKLNAIRLGLTNVQFKHSSEIQENYKKYDVAVAIKEIVSLQTLQETTAHILEHIKPSGAYFVSDTSFATGKIHFATPGKSRATLFQRRKIYHLPLRRIHLSSFFSFLNIKFFKSSQEIK